MAGEASLAWNSGHRVCQLDSRAPSQAAGALSLPFPGLTLGRLRAALWKSGSPGECVRSLLSISNTGLFYVISPKAPEGARVTLADEEMGLSLWALPCPLPRVGMTGNHPGELSLSLAQHVLVIH